MRSSIPESTLHRISRMVIKEAVEDKKMELMQSGTKIPAKDVDVLCLINTFDLYGLINDGINKYNNRNTVQGFVNDMVGNTNVPTMVESGNKVTAASKLGKAKPAVVHDNIYGNTKLTDTELKSSNILGATNIPTVVESSNKGTAASKLGEAKPVIVHKTTMITHNSPKLD